MRPGDGGEPVPKARADGVVVPAQQAPQRELQPGVLHRLARHGYIPGQEKSARCISSLLQQERSRERVARTDDAVLVLSLALLALPGALPGALPLPLRVAVAAL